VEARLFELYMKAGREIVESSRVDELSQATSYFVQALALRPRDPGAALEQDLAETCAQGLEAYDEEQWGKAIARLRTVIAEYPDYLDGKVVQSLYRAHVELGRAYEEAGNLQLAYEQYQQALSLPVDHAVVARLLDSLVPRLTPTPAPTPMPTTTPAAGTPAPASSSFTGSEVQMDQNLLVNPSFEEGWYDIYTGQVPDGWRFVWLDGVEFPGSADAAFAPETMVTQKTSVPPEERSLLFRDGSRCLKVFRGFTPVYGAAVQDVSGLDVGRNYRLIVPIFVDVFNWEGQKVAPGGEAARIRLGAAPLGATWRDESAITYSDWWDGANTPGFYLQYSDFSFDFEAEEPEMTIYIELAGIYGLTNNGFFVDDVALYPLGSSSTTPAPTE
jgi:hypothetical protein